MLNVVMNCRSHLWNIARTHWSRSMEMTHKLLRASDVWLTVIISSTKWVDVTFVIRFVLTFVTLSVHLAEDVTACKVGGRFGAWQQFWPNALADATNDQCYVRSHQHPQLQNCQWPQTSHKLFCTCIHTVKVTLTRLRRSQNLLGSKIAGLTMGHKKNLGVQGQWKTVPREMQTLRAGCK